MEAEQRFQYNGTEYSLSEMRKLESRFLLDLHDFGFISYLPIRCRFQVKCSRDYITLLFFQELYLKAANARFALSEAFNRTSFHEKRLDPSGGKKAMDWARSFYLNNAILWYQSTFDMLMQIVWFGCDLYKKHNFAPEGEEEQKFADICSRKIFSKVVDGCRRDYVFNYLTEDHPVRSILDNLHRSTHCKYVIAWANMLKHKTGFNYKETYTPIGVGYRNDLIINNTPPSDNKPKKMFIKIDGFNSAYCEPKHLYGLDEVIERLVNYHNELEVCARNIYEYLIKEKLIPQDAATSLERSEM